MPHLALRTGVVDIKNMTTTLLLLMTPAFCAPVTALLGQQPVRQVQKNGSDFLTASGALAELLELKLVEGHLQLVLPAADAGRNLCHQICGGGGSSSSSGDGRWWSTAQNQTLSVEIGSVEGRVGMMLPRPNTIGAFASLNATGGEPRNTTIRFVPDDGLSAWHLDPPGGRLVWLRDAADGASLIAIDGPEMKTVTAASFEQLGNRIDSHEILNRLPAVGIGIPQLPPWDKTALLIRQILEFDDTEWTEFQKEFADLEDQDFERREAASKRLLDDFGKHAVAIGYGLLGGAKTTETKSRLRAAVVARLEDPLHLAVHSVATSRLTEDPLSLVRVLQIQPAADESGSDQAIYDALRAMTGQTLGDDLRVWEEWLAAAGENPGSDLVPEKSDRRPIRKVQNEVTGPEDDSALPVVPFDSARTALARMLRLTIGDAGQIQLDRESWAGHFGGKPVAELIRKIQDEFAASGLPKSWLNVSGGLPPESVGYAQILFELYEESLEFSDQTMMANIGFNRQNAFVNGHRPPSLNRSAQFFELVTNLRLHESSQPQQNVEEKFFSMEVLDRSSLGRMVFCFEGLDGSFSLLLVGPHRKEIIWLGQDPEKGCWMHHVAPGQNRTLQAETAATLFEREQVYLSAQIFPFFASMGIDLSPPAGGPLLITDRKPER